MINKIEKLISIGKYRDYQAAGQVNFKKMTLIYGDNGGGKTTLTSVFRSLASNDPDIIRSRVSTNNTSPQSIQVSSIETSGNVFYTFGTNGWSAQLNDVEIFDIHFVNNNIYSGFSFNDEHKKQLHQFVIGAQGVQIQNRIEQNKSDKVLVRQRIANIEMQLVQQVGNNLTVSLIPSFLTIPEAQAIGIDQSITDAETALTNANANAIIQTLHPLTLFPRINFGLSFEELKVDLQATSRTIQEEAINALFSNHCAELEENGITGSEQWLQTGFLYTKTKFEDSETGTECPFCKKPIDNTVDIIKAYTVKFNDEFNELILRVNGHISSLERFNLDATILGIENIKSTNNERLVSWTPHLPNSIIIPLLDIISNEHLLREEFQNLSNLVQQKNQNPTTCVGIADVVTFERSLEQINTKIDECNSKITAYNLEIAAFKAGIQSVENAKSDVEKYRRIKKRFEEPIISLCSQLDAEKQGLRVLESTYTQLSQEQQTAATTFFSTYQSRINYYLTEVFKTHFKIEDVEHIPPRGRATQSKISFKLTIDGKDISFVEGQPFSARECLSEGDKSTIALAFFLSKLDVDSNLQNKILIFDDPLSSLDTNRRTYTVSLIRSLFQNFLILRKHT